MLLSWVGVALAGLLTAEKWGAVNLQCGPGNGCAVVAQHPSSSWFGIPVALFGLLMYLALAGFGVMRIWADEAAWKRTTKWGLMLSGVGVVVALALMWTMFTVIKVRCDYCLASHIILFIIFALHAIQLKMPAPSMEQRRMDPVFSVAGIVLAIGALSLQSAMPKTQVNLLPAELQPSAVLPDAQQTKGPADAKITIVEFADYVCPACRKVYPELQKALDANEGKVRFAFRNLPLYQIQGHEMSLPLAVASEFAKDQGKFWDFYHAAFDASSEQYIQSIDGVYAIAKSVGLDVDKLRNEIDSGESKYLEAVAQDSDRAASLGINATPSFVVFVEGENPRILMAGDVLKLLGATPPQDDGHGHGA